MKQNISFVVILAACIVTLPAHAKMIYRCHEDAAPGVTPNPLNNPCPDTEDIHLPMPGGQVMVFRAVAVPGVSFWGDTERNVMMGNGAAPMFEEPQQVTVAGSFPDGDRGWKYLMGKYEVTIAQYAIIKGEGDLQAGIQHLVQSSSGRKIYTELANSDVTSARSQELLSRPVAGILLRDLQEFPAQYTRWCYQDEACRKAMPKFGDVPGFFRLPTEIEWEYAARKTRKKYSEALPFEEDKAIQYAHISSDYIAHKTSQPVGYYLSVNGFYDLFGNVAELTEGRFLSQLNHGKPGGFSARGGSYSEIPGQLRVSMRREVAEFRTWPEISENQPKKVGIRLAIGSLNQPDDQDLLSKISNDYSSYRGSREQFQSASGDSTRAKVLKANDPLERIETLLGELANEQPGAVSSLNQINEQIQTARSLLIRSAEEMVSQLTRNTVLTVGEAKRSLMQISKANKTIKTLSPCQKDEYYEKCTSIVTGAQKKLPELNNAVERSFGLYVKMVQQLAEYRDFAKDELVKLKANDTVKGLDAVSVRLLDQHLNEYLEAGSAFDQKQWFDDIDKANK